MAPQETRVVVTKFLRDRPDDSWEFAAAREHNNAYSALERALQMQPAESPRPSPTSGLRGPRRRRLRDGQKWSFLPKDVFPRYLAVNADEGRAGDVQDHMLIERDPHQIVEGSIISAYAIEAHTTRSSNLRGRVRTSRGSTAASRRRPRTPTGFLGKTHPEERFDLELICAPRGAVVTSPATNGPAVESRGRACDAAHQAAVPRRARAVRRHRRS